MITEHPVLQIGIPSVLLPQLAPRKARQYFRTHLRVQRAYVPTVYEELNDKSTHFIYFTRHISNL